MPEHAAADEVTGAKESGQSGTRRGFIISGLQLPLPILTSISKCSTSSVSETRVVKASGFLSLKRFCKNLHDAANASVERSGFSGRCLEE